MSDYSSKLSNCRVNLCDAQLDLMDFVEGSGYVEPSDNQLFTIYNQINELIDFIDLISN